MLEEIIYSALPVRLRRTRPSLEEGAIALQRICNKVQTKPNPEGPELCGLPNTNAKS